MAWPTLFWIWDAASPSVGVLETLCSKRLAELSAKHDAERVFGQPCDVTDYEQVQALWAAAQAHWGKIDIWINNAGIAHPQTDFWDHEPQEIAAIVGTNVIGAMYGSKVALAGHAAAGLWQPVQHGGPGE